MSRFVDRKATDEVTLTNGDKVWVRQRLTAEEQAELSGALFHAKLDTATGELQLADVAIHQQHLSVARNYIVRWDFKGDDGEPVECTPENFARLDFETVRDIAQAVDKLQAARRGDAEKKGPSSSA